MSNKKYILVKNGQRTGQSFESMEEAQKIADQQNSLVESQGKPATEKLEVKENLLG